MVGKEQHQVGHALHQGYGAIQGGVALPRYPGGGQGGDEGILPQGLFSALDAAEQPACKEGPQLVQVHLVGQFRRDALFGALAGQFGGRVGGGAGQVRLLQEGVQRGAPFRPGQAALAHESGPGGQGFLLAVGEGGDADLGGHPGQGLAGIAPGELLRQPPGQDRVGGGRGRRGGGRGFLREGRGLQADGDAADRIGGQQRTAGGGAQFPPVRMQQSGGQVPLARALGLGQAVLVRAQGA